MRKKALLTSVALVAGLMQPAVAADWDALVHAGGQSANWLVYGGDLANTRFVDNDAINVGNVADLELKWIFQTGIIGSFENTPIVQDGVMYVTTPYNHVFAIDARDRAPALALRAQARHHDLLLRAQQPRRGARRRHGLHGDAGRHADRARQAHRRAALGDRDRRPGDGLFPDRRADDLPGQGDPRHLGRRIRHPRLHQRLRQEQRRAGLALAHHPGPGRGPARRHQGLVRRISPRKPTASTRSTATSRPRRRRSSPASTPTPGSAAAAPTG